MLKNLHFRTNFYVCLIIIIGFVCSSIISFKYNNSLFSSAMESTATLARDELESKIEAQVIPAQTLVRVMANDSFLKDTLKNKEDELNKEKVFEYLSRYYMQYNLLHAFVISDISGKYYNSGTQSGRFTSYSEEGKWYKDFLASEGEDIVYIEQSIYNGTYENIASTKIIDDGKVLGVVGVRLAGESFFTQFKNYYDKYNVKCSLVDKSGRVRYSFAASPDNTKDLFGSIGNEEYKNKVLNIAQKNGFWYPEEGARGYVASEFIPMLDMYLVAESPAFNIMEHLDLQLAVSIVIMTIVAVAVLLGTSAVFKKYNNRLIKATVTQELEYQKLLQNATEGMYENIFEYDITHNCASGEKTKDYFVSLGLDKNAEYTDMVSVIAGRQLKKEFQQLYRDTFNIERILDSFEKGITNISIDVIIKDTDNNPRWIRVTARTFYWSSDKSVRMISYRQNIDQQKKLEKELLEQAHRDGMTKLYNKFVTEEMIKNLFAEDKTLRHTLVLCDIDNFKDVNDKYGHSYGDKVITMFAQVLTDNFGKHNIVGRIGGDEFAVLIKNVYNEEDISKQLTKLCQDLSNLKMQEGDVTITASVGAAVFPLNGTSYEEIAEKADEALYYAKAHGKNLFNIYNESVTGDISSHVCQRDMITLIENASDGISKIAYTDTGFKILYFNRKRIDMIGVTAEEMSAEGYDVLSQYEPVSRQRAYDEFMKCEPKKEMFSIRGQVMHKDGRLINVSVRGVFVSELYEGKYPVFYDMFTIL